ncbi:hypothetical protein AYO21_11884 [Fonsecaea monophora]|uniref:Serine aminopeptidase S33 domain-containing protein n=1 Tax=Fonsecaea monophora TaxID=254056 RepID=A0A177EPR7_9EURO|nr:hypothetical protein AYO21_11884 [Fonsecaea monophora]OAG33984.1 hypothetical protein AYO21_11884 [Fonsecaea monophora]
MHQDLEIKTHDGTTIRAWFYAAGPKAPVIILSAGLSGVQEHFLPSFAESFQKAGIAAVSFDHRNWGLSDGLPRHHSNHYQQTQDTHDVVAYVSTELDIDPERIAIWGSSFSGGIALIAGAVDPRVKVVITQVPFVSGNHLRSQMPAPLLARIYEDRAATTESEPTYIPVFPEEYNAAQPDPAAAMMATEESWHYYQHIKELGIDKENRITMQTLFHAIRSEPSAFVPFLNKPLFMAIASNDSLISPSKQQEVFETAKDPKALVRFDSGHFSLYEGALFEKNIAAQIDFLHNHL